MIKILHTHFVLFLLLVSSISGLAQKSPQKFGRVKPVDFKTETCPIDSNAHAYFIFDYGFSKFDYAATTVRSDDPGRNKGFELYFTRHIRLKIVDTEGFDWTNFEIPLYREGSDEEKLISVKGCSYNLVNGKVEKTKLDRGDIISEETSKHWITKKVAMPNVREGAIVELEYTIKSEYYFNLRQWMFQFAIPVLHSEYQVYIPEYFKFGQTQKGYFPVERIENEKHQELTITYIQKDEGAAVQGYKTTNTLSYKENGYHFLAKDIPAFPYEKYLHSADNYLTQIEFELEYVKFPHSTMHSYTTSWDVISRNLQEHSNFGDDVKHSKHLEDVAQALLLAVPSDTIQRMEKAFEHIRNRMTWTGDMSKYTSSSLSKSYKESTGNCSDINLNLVALFQELGFESYPVVLSTQKNGLLHPAHASTSRLNYVIALVKLKGETYLFDATSSFSEVNLLPSRCLNGKGLIVSKYGVEWVDLMDRKQYLHTESTELELTEDLAFKGQFKMRLKDYAAFEKRSVIRAKNSLKEYEESIEKLHKGYELDSLLVSGVEDDWENGVEISGQFVHKNQASQTNDLIYFSPAYFPFFDENPFQLADRQYPVEFDYPYIIRQIYSYTLPAGMTISEVPKPIVVKTPDSGLMYVYQISQMGNKVMLMLTVSINKTLFLPEEYQGIKSIFQLMADKQKEMIVLKQGK